MKLDKELIQYVALFENVTGTSVNDCFYYSEDKLLFIVKEGQVRKAIGDKGKNVIKLAEMMKKKIKIVEGHSDPIQFVRSFISPIKAEDIVLDEGIVTITVEGVQEKGLLIGRGGQNLRGMEKVVQKYFPDIIEIKVV